MYKYYSLKQLESDILDSVSAANNQYIVGIGVSGLSLKLTEEDYKKFRIDTTDKYYAVDPALTGNAPEYPDTSKESGMKMNFAGITITIDKVVECQTEEHL